ncbi:polyprenol phosphomannose-dependent alpha 1,6 mannosyltransferase MptB [Symbioplanes lichenis]|uniref:polyprenol phosphomannose-dependent alpha 1,6 mannosyltransferase MptB n=1 Tax=Symbioplanes lichenis TaxID=1629072 RepID=UPI002738EEB4|nr:polyprenol phosphomannose-dependent alpha 1,6 mannosyltransferase MptB [Actinoplanes lichenis]
MRSDHALAAATGGAGALLVAAGGPLGRPGLVCAYAGLTLLVLGWWWYGRCGPAPARHRWATLGLWSAPLVLAPPLFSRDVYSYLAQGLMADSGIDVYRFGPERLGGPVAAQVPALWQDTPSPYGPVWLLISRTVTAVTGTHLGAGVTGMRLVAAGGVALIALAVPVLARAGGVDGARAWWLVVLNPLVLIHLVSGAHNDALMAGLLAVGLAAAVRRRPILGAVVVSLAALVKAPAAAGLAAVALIWTTNAATKEVTDGKPVSRTAAMAAAGAVGAAVTVVVGELTGFGYAWITALGTPVSPGNWSLTGVLERMTGQHGWRWAGVLIVVVVAIAAYRMKPVAALGVLLLAVVVFGPALRPWYLLWALLPLAVSRPGAHRWLVPASAALTLVVLPDGYAADQDELRLATLGVVLGIATLALAVTRAPERRPAL